MTYAVDRYQIVFHCVEDAIDAKHSLMHFDSHTLSFGGQAVAVRVIRKRLHFFENLISPPHGVLWRPISNVGKDAVNIFKRLLRDIDPKFHASLAVSAVRQKAASCCQLSLDRD